jgi:hypothetical protein
MDITYLKMARRLWNVDYLPYWQNRENQRKWVRALRVVGDHWLLRDATKRLEVAKNV